MSDILSDVDWAIEIAAYRTAPPDREGDYYDTLAAHDEALRARLAEATELLHRTQRLVAGTRLYDDIRAFLASGVDDA